MDERENTETEIEDYGEYFELEIIPAVHIDEILSIKYNLTSLMSNYADRDMFRVFLDEDDLYFEVCNMSGKYISCGLLHRSTDELIEEFESENCDEIFEYIISYSTDNDCETTDPVDFIVLEPNHRKEVSKILSKVMVLSSMLVKNIDKIDKSDSKNIEYCITMLEDIVKKHT